MLAQGQPADRIVTRAHAELDLTDQVAVRSFVDAARTLGLTTVAECVETPEVLLELVRLGVGEVQGFLLHRPEPLADVVAAAPESTSVY